MLCLVKDEPCDFWDALNLSVHSMSTIGFGSIVPHSALANTAVAIEFWIAVLMGAAAANLIYVPKSLHSPSFHFIFHLILHCRGVTQQPRPGGCYSLGSVLPAAEWLSRT